MASAQIHAGVARKARGKSARLFGLDNGIIVCGPCHEPRVGSLTGRTHILPWVLLVEFI